MAVPLGPDPVDRSAVTLGLLVIAALVAVEGVLFYLLPQNGYYLGMLYTGILALGASLALFLVGSLYHREVPRLSFSGAFWFGSIMLLGADLATPNTAFGDPDQMNGTVARIPLLSFTLAIIAVGISAYVWSAYTRSAGDDTGGEEDVADETGDATSGSTD